MRTIENIDRTILQRVTEDDVAMWMAAKLEDVRESGLPCHYLDLTMHWMKHSREYVCGWGAQSPGDGMCTVNSSTAFTAIDELWKLVFGEPDKRAVEIRRKAAALIAEAEELEKLAAQQTQPVGA